jgi:hypothetical protein
MEQMPARVHEISATGNIYARPIMTARLVTHTINCWMEMTLDWAGPQA